MASAFILRRSQVRSLLLPQNAEGRAEANPASRRNHLLRSLARWGSQGTSKRKVYEKNGGGPCELSDRNGIERDLKADGVERDGIQPVSTTRRNEVISESSATYEIGHRKRIGSSVRPREEWEIMKAE